MPLDINAFRSIANQNPDKLVYVHGQSLKTTRNQERHGAHTYRAATNAFLKACTDHYGSRMGEAIVKFLLADIEGGKPLTARKIKALVEFADEKMGSADKLSTGVKEIGLSEIGKDKMLRVGFRQSTKLAKADAGQKSAAAATLGAFKFDANGKVDIEAVLRHLNTLHAYIDRETEARGFSVVRPMAPVRDPGAPDAPAPEAPVEQLSQAEIEGAKLFEKHFFTAIDAMDNNELSAVYQGLISKQTDGFKKELARIINHPGAAPKTVALAEKAFADLSRIEAMVVSEISRRMILDKTPDDQKANVPSLMERYAGEGAPTANHYAGEGDMTTTNLGIMARSAAQGSNIAKTANAKTDGLFKSHGMGEVDSKKIGDTLRAQELTINMRFATFMGRRKDGSQGTPLLNQPNAHLTNAYEAMEAQNIDPMGDQDLRFRNQVEKSFFPEYSAEPLSGKSRPVYGALNTAKYTAGGADTAGGTYGHVVVVLKPHVKQKCTYTLDDTFFAARVSMPESKRAEIEENLIAAFAPRLKDPAAALAALRDPESAGGRTLTRFFQSLGSSANDISARTLAHYTRLLADFISTLLKDGEAPVAHEDIDAHFVAKYMIVKPQTTVADFDHIENLFAQSTDSTAVGMGLATLKSQSNPKTPFSLQGVSYIEAQFHSPVLLDRDVEEIRVDTAEMDEFYSREFDKLPQAEREALDREEWVAARIEEAKNQIKADSAGAPYKVTFYNSENVVDAEATLAVQVLGEISLETASRLKDDLVAFANSYLNEHRAELMDDILKAVSVNIEKGRIFDLCGRNLERIPDWLQAAIDADLQKAISRYGTDPMVLSEKHIRSNLRQKVVDVLSVVMRAMSAMDASGITDAAEREAVLKEMLRLNTSRDGTAAEKFVELHVAGKKALADVNALARETLEKDVEGGAQMLKNAFAGQPPLAGVALDGVTASIRKELSLIKSALAAGKVPTAQRNAEGFAKRLRENAVKPFLEKKARIMQSQVFMKFPTDDERKAFLKWATSAGQLKTSAQFEGVYEGSNLLTDALEAKIKSGAPLGAQDLVDCYKAFFPTCYDYMEEDAKQHNEYGPDDRQCFVGRITSVALSRLALRVGQEGLAKIAAVLDSPEGRWFHNAILRGQSFDNSRVERGGTLETAGAFMEVLLANLTKDYGLTIHQTSDTGNVDYRIVPPFARAFLAQINPREAQEAEARYPYDPASSGARRLANVPAPVNPAALPQDKAGRKAFLVDRMLPIYHAHEKGFDYGYNYHGRTHATRSFVFSIAMGNILKEKGVALDMNAVALATAGHDTGRQKNGRDTEASEKRSADTVVAAVNEAYPGAAGPGWTAQVEANITTKTAEQETIEGYLFKCADSLDYTRVGELDEGHFPFLQEPIATPDGFVLPTDTGIRRQLMKEAKLLSELTSPHVLIKAERDQLADELVDLPAGQEFDVKNARLQEIDQQILQSEKQQTDTLSNQQIVDLVEDAIRSRPQDFPLLTKYYLNAE